MLNIKEQLKQALTDLGYAEDLINIDYPTHAKFGDYSTNLAMALAKPEKKNPLEVAEAIISKLNSDKFITETFDKIQAVKPGFINFTLKKSFLLDKLNTIGKEAAYYGKNNVGEGRKIQIEFISANPTGPLTLANGRGGVTGDVLSSIMELSGYEVEREYYVNDAGNQIKTFGLSILAAAGLIADEENYYKGEYVKEWAEDNKDKVNNYKSDPEILGRIAANDYLANHIKPAIKQFGIAFNRFTSEYEDIRQPGLVDEALNIFKEKKVVFENDQALWLVTTKFGDEKDRVLITSEGEQTYLMVDSGHYLESVKRGFKYKINILGADHHGYVKRIQVAAQTVGLEKSEIIIMQLVRIVKDGQEVRMSKRKGQFVLLQDLIDEIGKDAARWFFLTRSPESHIDIDLTVAKEKSKKNPVYYVQYAYTRLHSILDKAEEIASKKAPEGNELTEAEAALISYLLRWPELVENISQTYQVQNLTTYAHDLAERVQKFYETSYVIEGGEVNTMRLQLAKSAKQTLLNILKVMGIEAPSQM